MLEIIVVIFLSIKIRKIIIAKNLRPGKYIVTMLLLWLSLELLSIGIAFKITGDLFSAVPFGIIGAGIGGYLGYKLAVNAEPATQN